MGVEVISIGWYKITEGLERHREDFALNLINIRQYAGFLLKEN